MKLLRPLLLFLIQFVALASHCQSSNSNYVRTIQRLDSVGSNLHVAVQYFV